MKRVRARSLNRERMPTVAAWVDAVRAAFGECRVAYARENGVELETEAHRRQREAIERGEIRVVRSPEPGCAFAAESPADRRDESSRLR